ncbi:hypothetical protein Poly30_36840 [Planctomycetes bacterium Poly30]|uniref:Uncharacterized protein n=1 Tax=Saltatorellus ferox TaxID=2528018 RepID=A0A518EVR4_9BACT|nr:hypothetical protein Poly30_36840 [Planctomycetes bacterium Poly30]
MQNLALRFLMVVSVLAPWAPGCSGEPQIDAKKVEAARSELLEQVKAGKARWGWGGDPAQEGRERAALEAVLAPAIDATSEANVEDTWYDEPGGHEGGWTTTRIMEAIERRSLAHGVHLQRGEHEAFFEGLEATQGLAATLLLLEDSLPSMTGFFALRVRWIGDELGREERQVPWTRADALRLKAFLGSALEALEPDARPLRFTFWDLIGTGLQEESAEGPEAQAAAVLLGQEFASREADLMRKLEGLLDLPSVTAMKAARALAEGEDGQMLDYWFWSSVQGYLHAMMSARSEIETLRLALEVSLTGEPATAKSSHGHGIRAEVMRDFVEAREEKPEGEEEWRVRVPLVQVQ